MLEIGAQTVSFQSGPGDVLGHAIGVGGPRGKLVGIEGELVLHVLHDELGDKEEDLVGVSYAMGFYNRK